MDFHPISRIFPLIYGQAYSDLCADVLKYGVREPVWLYEGSILDGRNRWRASSAMGVHCPTRDYEGTEPTQFVLSLNLHRRHLSESQRAMVAANVANLKHGGNRHAEQDADLHPERVTDVVTQKGAAEMLNISTRLVSAATKIKNTAPESIVRAVEAGNVSVGLAAKVAALPEAQRIAVAAEAASAPPDQAAKVLREAVKTLMPDATRRPTLGPGRRGMEDG